MPYVEEVRETMWWLIAPGLTMRVCCSSSRKAEETQPIIGFRRWKKETKETIERRSKPLAGYIPKGGERDSKSKLFEVLKNVWLALGSKRWPGFMLHIPPIHTGYNH
jgi:hypothetical protein